MSGENTDSHRLGLEHRKETCFELGNLLRLLAMQLRESVLPTGHCLTVSPATHMVGNPLSCSHLPLGNLAQVSLVESVTLEGISIGESGWDEMVRRGSVSYLTVTSPPDTSGSLLPQSSYSLLFTCERQFP